MASLQRQGLILRFSVRTRIGVRKEVQKMNKKLSSNPVRPIAFFLTAIILACTFGFTVDGWQTGDRPADGDNNLPSQESQGNENEVEENDRGL